MEDHHFLLWVESNRVQRISEIWFFVLKKNNNKNANVDFEKVVYFAALPPLQELPGGGRGGLCYYQPIFQAILNRFWKQNRNKAIKAISEQDSVINQRITKKLSISQHFYCYKNFQGTLDMDSDTMNLFFGQFINEISSFLQTGFRWIFVQMNKDFWCL